MKNIKILALIILSIFIVSCWKTNENITSTWTVVEQKTEKIKVSSSIIPISSIVNYIWENEVEVENIIPAWVSPHDFELTPQNLVALEKSQVVFSIWLEHIDWFLEKSQNKNKVNLSDWINLLEAEEHHHDEDEHHNEKEDHENEEHKDEENHDKDPHIWLGEENLKIISEKITKKLSEIKPEKKEIFEKNKANFDSEIENIFKKFREENTNKKANHFIVFHDAYNYLLKSVNINSDKKEVFSENVSAEINPAHLKELLQEIKEHKIKIIFKEPQFNSKQMENFAKENNLKLLDLDPVWTDFTKEWFIKNLKNNLENLKNIY